MAKADQNPSTILPGRYRVGDRVTVKDLPAIFYSRTQKFARGVTGTVAMLTYPDLTPADEAFNHEASQEQYYIVRFKQQDLWEGYPYPNDTLQSEYPDSWLEPATS